MIPRGFGVTFLNVNCHILDATLTLVDADLHIGIIAYAKCMSFARHLEGCVVHLLKVSPCGSRHKGPQILVLSLILVVHRALVGPPVAAHFVLSAEDTHK